MYQQVEHYKLCILYILCTHVFLRLRKYTAVIFLYSTDRLNTLMEAFCVLCAVRTESLCVI